MNQGIQHIGYKMWVPRSNSTNGINGLFGRSIRLRHSHFGPLVVGFEMSVTKRSYHWSHRICCKDYAQMLTTKQQSIWLQKKNWNKTSAWYHIMNSKFETQPDVSVEWCFFEGAVMDQGIPQNILAEFKGTTRYLHLKYLYLFFADTIFPPLILTPASYPFCLYVRVFFQCIDGRKKTTPLLRNSKTIPCDS